MSERRPRPRVDRRSKLESRPRKDRPFEYLFYADFEGSVAEEAPECAIAELGTCTSFLKVLGSYPAHKQD